MIKIYEGGLKPEEIFDRTEEKNTVGDIVADIIADVRKNGDTALKQYSAKFDGAVLENIEVTQEEIDAAFEATEPEFVEIIKEAAENIREFHRHQIKTGFVITPRDGVVLGQRVIPLERVGLYVPGGTASYPSSVLMNCIPAKLAGCDEIVMVTPPSKDGSVNPAILAAAKVAGVDRIFKVGGAQAVGAMAYGTDTVPAVDKIFGPGNRYVTKAKEIVSRKVAIDMPAGPSEVLVMADETAVPAFVASDLLSQAEHGPDSQVILVCPSDQIADKVEAEVERQLQLLPRKDVAVKALENSRVLVIPSLEAQIEFVNAYAAEHLIISVEHPWKVAECITAAGSVFIGNYTPESAGDYASGTNHTLPTSGWARSMSGVNLDSFIRKITYQEITKEGISQLGKTIVTMAQAEGLDAHANAAAIRMEK